MITNYLKILNEIIKSNIHFFKQINRLYKQTPQKKC